MEQSAKARQFMAKVKLGCVGIRVSELGALEQIAKEWMVLVDAIGRVPELAPYMDPYRRINQDVAVEIAYCSSPWYGATRGY